MMSMVYLVEQICREWSLITETRETHKNLFTFLLTALSESRKKQAQCIAKGTYVNMNTMDSLYNRLFQSREPETFKTLYYLNSITEALKDSNYLNQACFNEFVKSFDMGNRRDNADLHIIRSFSIQNTQLHQLIQHSCVRELDCFEESASRFLFALLANNNQLASIDKEMIDSIVSTSQQLEMKLQNYSSFSYRIFALVVSSLYNAIKEGMNDFSSLEASIQPYFEKMKEEVKVLKSEQFFNSFMLNQINQTVNRTVVWLNMLLPNNKKCSKPSAAKEPSSALIVKVIAMLLNMIQPLEEEVSKYSSNDYSAILEKNQLMKGVGL